MGILPLRIDPPEIKEGYQWLTSNPNFDQAWDRQKNLPYDRTMYRLTVEIPRKHLKKLLKFDEDIERLIPRHMYEALSGYGDPESWYVFHGQIPAKWIKDTEIKPEELREVAPDRAKPIVTIDGLWEIIKSCKIKEDFGGEKAVSSRMFTVAANKMFDMGVVDDDFFKGLVGVGYTPQDIGIMMGRIEH